MKCVLGTCECGRHMDHCPACNGEMDAHALRLMDNWSTARECKCGRTVVFWVGERPVETCRDSSCNAKKTC